MRQLLLQFDILAEARPFTICLEDNEPLVPKTPAEVKERVPPYVFKNQEQYMECPLCRRIYWRGTHWAAMKKWLEKLKIENYEILTTYVLRDLEVSIWNFKPEVYHESL